MRKSWAMAAVAALMLSVGMAQAGDDFDAQMTKQCPSMAAWMNAKEAEVTADRKAHPLGKPSEPELRAELLKMGDADQKARNAAIADGHKHQDQELAKAILAVDARNLPRIKQIDTTQGFPTPIQVGNDGVQAAFILVQHADRDPAFQAHVLGELKSRPGQGGVGAQDYALLTDRVLLAQHKLQRYGTQFKAPDGKTQMQPRPMEDPANVDKRRAAIGLPPLADYACMLGVVYRVPAKS